MLTVKSCINDGHGGTNIVLEHSFQKISTKECKDILHNLPVIISGAGGDPDMEELLKYQPHKWYREGKHRLDEGLIQDSLTWYGIQLDPSQSYTVREFKIKNPTEELSPILISVIVVDSKVIILEIIQDS